MNQPNPYTVNIPKSDTGFITCDAHASNHQKVIITGFPNGKRVTFTGTGEGVGMKQNGESSYSFGPFTSDITLNFTFEYSANGAPYQMAFIRNAPTEATIGKLTILQITSEDAIDNDDNDTYLHLVYKAS